MDPSFWDEHGNEISAAITLIVTAAVAFVADRFVLSRGPRAAERFGERAVSRATQTRLKIIRRLVVVTILVIGIALALSQFESIKRFATGILASTAVLGVVIGFAARQTLGNLIAGLLLATTQPIRIGDRVTIEDVTGRVDDLSLSYTYIDPGDGRLVVVPNEVVVTGVVVNHSRGDPSAPVAASVWVSPDADLAAARQALGPVAQQVQVAEVTAEGVRLEIRHVVEGDRTRAGDEEAALRESAQGVLREAGLLGDSASR